MTVEEDPQATVAMDQLMGIPGPAEQAQEVITTEKEQWPPTLGDLMCLISKSWWDLWTAYTGFTIEDGDTEAYVADVVESERPQQPGPIDNNDLIDQEAIDGLGAELKDGLVEGTHYILVFQRTWEKLHSWYGGGPLIKRNVVKEGLEKTKLKTDVYPFKLKIQYDNKESVLLISKQATVGDLKESACKLFKLEEVDVAMWDYFNQSRYGTLETKLSLTLEQARIFDKQDILLEEKDANGADGDTANSTLFAPTSLNIGTSSLGRSTIAADDSVTQSAGRPAGLCGLQNLGNTCFMNSSIQCLSHTVPLLRVFLNDNYKDDINRENPLGLGGELAEAFGSLLHKQWQGDVGVVVPRGFKQKLARFAPQFQGYIQHDSQELLAFLLDGLHEDLNRIKKKPYIEEKDADDRPDQLVAKEAWDNYRARNDSVVVDHFQGLYKSTLVCPQCNFRSVKFDPFMYLSLPLPSSKTRTLNVTAIHTDGSCPPTVYAVDVPKAGTVGHLYTALAKLLQLPSDKPEEVILIAELQATRINKKYEKPDARLTEIRERSQLLAYCYPSPTRGPKSESKEVHLFHRQANKRPYSSLSRETFAAPLVLWLPEEEVQHLSVEPLKGSWGTEYVVKDSMVLGVALEAALRPFKRQRTNACAEPDVDADANKENEDSNTAPGAGTMDISVATPLASEQYPDDQSNGASCASDVEENNNNVQLDDLVTDDASNTGVDCEDVQEDVGEPGDTEPDGTAMASVPVRPFDMWERQKEMTSNPAQSSDNCETSSGPPFHLKRANFNGETQFTTEPSAISSSPMFFSIDWQPDGGGMYDLQNLEQPQMDESARRASDKEGQSNRVTLDQCLESFTQPEQLDPEDSWYCSRCKDHVQADKKLDLWTAPEVLVVHLKRFSYSRLWRDKLDTQVEFPLMGLDLTKYLLHQQASKPPPTYDLYAVSNHYGGMGGGHYTAYVKHVSGKWYCFDDSHVNEISEDNIQTAAAYVLFYRRRDRIQDDSNIEIPEPSTNAHSSPVDSGLMDTSPTANGGTLANGTNGMCTSSPSSSSSVMADDPNAEEMDVMPSQPVDNALNSTR